MKTVSLFAAAFALCFARADVTTNVYSTAQTVSAVLSDAESAQTAVLVRGPAAYNQYVELTGDNAYSGGTFVESGTLSVGHAHALGTGPIHCASGVTVRVTVSFRALGTSLKQALLDRLVVDAPAGGGEPWVAIKLDGDGLRNDVDFSGQPYLWLCSTPVKNEAHVLEGLFEPEGNVYRFGYAGHAMGGDAYGGICVTNLVDAPDGTPRHVHLRGYGLTTFPGTFMSASKFSWNVSYSGRFTAEDRAYFYMGTAGDFGVATNAAYAADKITLRNGAYWRAQHASQTFGEGYGLRMEGDVLWYHGGATTETHNTFKGSLSGSGSIRFVDKGGALFAGTNNVYSGELVVDGTYSGQQFVIIGDGAHFSWGTGTIRFLRAQRQLILDADSDVAFNGAVTGTCGTSTIKRGTGTLTLMRDWPHATDDGAPRFSVEAGTLRRGVEETTPMTGTIYVAAKAVFDLNFLPAETVYLPVGGGAIVNPYEGKMTFAQTLGGTTNFNGRLVGDVTVALAAGDDYVLGDGAEITGSLGVDSGRVTFEGTYLAETDVAVGANATLAFGPTDYMRYMPCEVFGGLRELQFSTGLTPKEKKLDFLYATDATPTKTTNAAPFVEYDGVTSYGNGNFASYPYDPNWDTADKDDAEALAKLPLARIFGDGAYGGNFKGVRFTGWFHADEAGEYGFTCAADDGLALYVDGARICYALTTAFCAEAKVTLAAGWHKFAATFYDEWGYAYFWCRMRAPGETETHEIPATFFCGAPGVVKLGRITGTGTVMVTADGSWPQADFSGFAGKVPGNVNDAGKIALGTATIDFQQPWSAGGENWAAASATAGQGWREEDENGVAYVIAQGLRNGGGAAVNSTKRIALDEPWTIAFDFAILEPKDYSIGDGFSVGLHDCGATGVPQSWSFNRFGDSSGYGLQAYVMSTYTPLAWVNGQKLNTSANACPSTNSTFLAGNAIYKSSLHVEMEWTLDALIVRLSSGGETWTSTNAAAKTELPAKFPNGAYFGVWGVDGWFYCRKRVTNLSVKGDQFAVEPQTFGGTLGFAGGAVTLVGDGGTNGVLNADFDVAGPASLALRYLQSPVALAGDYWHFSAAADATLTFGAGLALPAGPIVISVDKPADGGKRLLADFTALGLAAYPDFVLAPDTHARLKVADGKLWANFDWGTALIVR